MLVTQLVLPEPQLEAGEEAAAERAEVYRRDMRKKRLALSWGARKLCARKRVRECLRSLIPNTDGSGAGAGVYLREGVGHFGGVIRCGSPWVCPTCGPKIAAERGKEIERAAVTHWGTGGALAWQLLSVPHDVGMDLAELRKLITTAFRKLQQHRLYREARARTGLLGTIRKLEVTHGPNGWHPHLHVTYYWRGDVTEAEERLFESVVQDVWIKTVTAAGYREPIRELLKLERLRPGSAAWTRYLAKMVGDELGNDSVKVAKKGHRSPLRILADATREIKASGDTTSPDALLYREFEAGMFRAQQLTWSRGLKQRFAIDERTDEQIAADEVGGELVTVISPTLWRLATSYVNGLHGILEAAESAFKGGTDPERAVKRYLRGLLERHNHRTGEATTWQSSGGSG